MLSNFILPSIFEDKILIRLFKIISVFLFCFIIVFQVLNICLEYDDANHATVAKNMAFGYGYASSYNGIQLFPSAISVGYPFVLPVAVAIKIFSNKYWVPSVTTAVICLLLLLIMMYLPKKIKYITEKQLWIWRSVFMGLIIFASNLRNADSFILKQGEISRYNGAFSMMLGEFPSALMVVISAFILILSDNRKILYFTAGIIASLAFLTKTITLISIVPICIAYLFFNYGNLKSKLNFIFFLTLGFLVPIISFEFYKFITFGGLDKYLILKKLDYSFFKEEGSGLDSTVFITTADKIKSMIYEIGFLRFIILIVLPLWVIISGVFNKINKNINILVCMLASAVLLHAIWWIFFSPVGWIRHFLICWTLFLTMISIFVFLINDKNKYIYLVIILLFLTTPCSSKINKMFLSLNKYIDIQMTKNNALFEARDFIINNKQYKYYGAGWWANRRLEYILPTINNFSDALDPLQFNPTIKNKVIVRDVEYWNWINEPNIEKIRQQSEKHIIFQNSHYVMSLYVEE